MRLEYEGSKLDFFKSLYQEAEDAMAAETELMARRMAQYNGDDAIDGSSVRAKQVRNITYELIESQVSGYIPTPSVSPMVEATETERNAKSIETLLKAKRNELPYERMNDLDERYSPIYGGSVWLVEWDESLTNHNTTGDIKLTVLPPTNFVGQPNVYNIEDMDYCFTRFETTKDDIVRRYDVTYEEAEETDTEEHDDGNTATMYVCYYKDEDERICQFGWSGDAVLIDIADYYSRRRKVCRKCGEREGICSCEKPAFKTETAEYELLTKDIPLSDGTIIPARTPKIENGQAVTVAKSTQAKDAEGNMVFNTTSGLVTPLVETEVEFVTEQTKLPYYMPKVFPIVIRKNTSKEDAVFGQSDCDAIRPQQQAINKIESRIMEKLLRSAVTPVVPEDAATRVDNSVFGTVIELQPGENKGMYGVIDTTPNIAQDMAMSERYYDQAKRIIGISDSFQGQYDSSAQSGVAKQLQIQQSAGRLDSKKRMKNAAYADIDRVIFTLYLAYADEPRPYVYTDFDGKRQNVQFNRYDFLEIDSAGEYYYEDRYLFSADASIDTDNNRQYVWAENVKNFQAGTYGNPALPETLLVYWRNMERAHYPNARENVERFERIIEAQQVQQGQIQQLGGQV